MTLDDFTDTRTMRDGSTRTYHTPRETRFMVRSVQAELRALNKCINGPLVGNVGKKGIEHGAVVSAGRCQRCLDVKRRTH